MFDKILLPITEALARIRALAQVPGLGLTVETVEGGSPAGPNLLVCVTVEVAAARSP